MENLLAVVHALATQTRTEARTAEQYRDAFLGRFNALIRAEEASISGSEADLRTLVSMGLEAAGPNRWHVDDSPTVALKKLQITPFSLMLNELTTNAWKYGALSQPGGVIRVSWDIDRSLDTAVVKFHWQEENGPTVARPKVAGFGTSLIKASVERGLSGTAELHFGPAGFQVRVSFPIE